MNLKLILFAISIVQFSVCHPISNESSNCEYKNYANYTSSIIVDCHGTVFLPSTCYKKDVNVSSVSAVSFENCRIAEYSDILNQFSNISKLIFSKDNILPSANFSNFEHLSLFKSIGSTINTTTTSTAELSMNAADLELFSFKGDQTSNRLSSISLQNAAQLEQFYLEKLKISSLPDDLLTNSTNLKIFSVQECEIENIDSMILPHSLRLMDFSLNKIKELPKNAVKNLTNLQVLKFSYNTISKIEDDTFSQMQNLVFLSLSANGLNEINKTTLKGLNNLMFADFQQNFIQHLEDGVFELTPKLLVLVLSDNEISSLNQHMFAGLKRLTILTMDENQIRELTAESFGNLTELRSLDMRSGLLETVDFNAFANLPKLEHVSLADNRISRLVKMAPTAWSNNNQTTNNTFRSDMFEYMKDVDLEWMTQIYNKTKDFYSVETNNGLPFETFFLKFFVDIYMKNYPEMGTGPNYGLKLLDLSGNQLTEIENNIFDEFKSLTDLNLRGNPITTLHLESFVGLNELELLHLGGCKLTSIDFSIFTYLTKLDILYLYGNQLKTITAASQSQPSIKILLLNDNQLSAFPMKKSNFPNLKKLDISKNLLNCSNMDPSFANIAFYRCIY